MEEFEFACVALAREYSRDAEQCIIRAKGVERAWEFFLQVLEVSSVPSARTQASILLAGVLVQKWDEMSEEEREMIKDSIFHKLKNSRSGGIEAAVELQLLRIATFVVKKSVLDGDPDENRMKYLNDLDVLEWKNSPRLFVRFWFCMTEEFSVSKSRLSLGVPLRFHQSAAETFTSAFLPPLFQSCIDIFSSIGFCKVFIFQS
eukprot:TRINITY_DN1159_c0_g2_i3.p1 TRINITY_DN1159_c0_g2~~TRINITY_DN1159_c0_g2_i3.p1  ORF type:complete len:203 (+),score=59.44 TRINITY_DN1159_c0_g2_i3:132-740(+)